MAFARKIQGALKSCSRSGTCRNRTLESATAGRDATTIFALDEKRWTVMPRRARPWWMFLLAATFIGYFAFLVYCDVRRPEPYGYAASFHHDRMVLSTVAAKTPAATAGLAAGDVIETADGRLITGPDDWAA